MQDNFCKETCCGEFSHCEDQALDLPEHLENVDYCGELFHMASNGCAKLSWSRVCLLLSKSQYYIHILKVKRRPLQTLSRLPQPRELTSTFLTSRNIAATFAREGEAQVEIDWKPRN